LLLVVSAEGIRGAVRKKEEPEEKQQTNKPSACKVGGDLVEMQDVKVTKAEKRRLKQVLTEASPYTVQNNHPTTAGSIPTAADFNT
jgi:hypothetical protein